MIVRGGRQANTRNYDIILSTAPSAQYSNNNNNNNAFYTFSRGERVTRDAWDDDDDAHRVPTHVITL